AALFFSGQTNTDRLLRQVQHVAHRRFDEIILSQILVDRLRLRRRLHNYQRTCHVAFVTPLSFAGRLSGRACVLLANLGLMRQTAVWIHLPLNRRANSNIYNKTLPNCFPGICRTIPFISRSKSVARTSDEFKPELSTMSSIGFGSSTL